MEEEKNTSQNSLFPSNWTLGRNSFPDTTYVQETTRLGTYPGDWSLSTIPEFISDTTQAPSQENAAKDEISLTASDTQVPTSAILSPASFETSWTLPLTANLHQPASTPIDDERPFLSDWSLSPKRDKRGVEEAVANAPDLVGMIPGHVIPHATPSSGQEMITPLMGNYASVVPGNFWPSGYMGTGTSLQSNLRSASNKSLSQPVNGIIWHPVGYTDGASWNSATSPHSRDGLPVQVRFAPINAITSASSSSLRTSSSLPASRNNALYQIPRPAAFDATSPQSFQDSAGSSQSYCLPRPAGFGHENITPPVSNMSRHSIQSPAHPEDEHLVTSSPSRDPAPHDRMKMSFTASGIPVQATTLPTTDRYSWLYTDGEQLYKIP